MLPNQYKPKANHPWRQYKNAVKPEQLDNSPQQIITLHEFIIELSSNWDTFEIYPDEDVLEANLLKCLSQKKQALWLANFIRKHYAPNEFDISKL
jgi:hypothetical protein